MTFARRPTKEWKLHILDAKAPGRVALCGVGTRGYDDPLFADTEKVTCRRCLEKEKTQQQALMKRCAFVEKKPSNPLKPRASQKK